MTTTTRPIRDVIDQSNEDYVVDCENESKLKQIAETILERRQAKLFYIHV